MKRFLLIVIFIILNVFNIYARNLPIGVYLSLTGPIAAWGQPELQGIEVAHLMRKKLDKSHIKLVVLDVGSKTEGAALAAEKFATKNIKFVVGPVATPMALSALPILEKHKIVDVIPTANGLGLVETRSFASRVCLTNDVQAKVMADYIYSAGLRKGVIIEDVSTEYSLDLTHRFKNNFETDGGKIIKIFKISSNQKDFTSIITNLKILKPQFIYFTNYYNTIALFLRQLGQLKLKTRLFAGSAASSHALLEIAGKHADGLIFTDDFDPLIPQNELAKKFIKLFKSRYHRLPDSPEALAADAYLLLLNGIKKFGHNVTKVARYVRNTIFHGITGKIIIKNGKVNRTVILREVKNSTFIPVALYEP